MLFRSLIEKAVIDFTIEEMEDSLSRSMFRQLSEIYFEEKSLKADKLFDIFSREEEMEFLNNALNLDSDIEDPVTAYNEIYLNMKLFSIDQKINRYAGMIKTGPAGMQEYMTEIEILRREKEKLSNYLYNRGSSKKGI